MEPADFAHLIVALFALGAATSTALLAKTFQDKVVRLMWLIAVLLAIIADGVR